MAGGVERAKKLKRPEEKPASIFALLSISPPSMRFPRRSAETNCATKRRIGKVRKPTKADQPTGGCPSTKGKAQDKSNPIFPSLGPTRLGRKRNGIRKWGLPSCSCRIPLYSPISTGDCTTKGTRVLLGSISYFLYTLWVCLWNSSLSPAAFTRTWSIRGCIKVIIWAVRTDFRDTGRRRARIRSVYSAMAIPTAAPPGRTMERPESIRPITPEFKSTYRPQMNWKGAKKLMSGRSLKLAGASMSPAARAGAADAARTEKATPTVAAARARSPAVTSDSGSNPSSSSAANRAASSFHSSLPTENLLPLSSSRSRGAAVSSGRFTRRPAGRLDLRPLCLRKELPFETTNAEGTEDVGVSADAAATTAETHATASRGRIALAAFILANYRPFAVSDRALLCSSHSGQG
mmetsp:Transcript_29906/g.58664  ORF Transcript_29906/g.58664 Transcript_29906/m.58664 type:complete len:406 (+) Transcript_29906:1058-2275(+)